MAETCVTKRKTWAFAPNITIDEEWCEDEGAFIAGIPSNMSDNLLKVETPNLSERSSRSLEFSDASSDNSLTTNNKLDERSGSVISREMESHLTKLVAKFRKRTAAVRDIVESEANLAKEDAVSETDLSAPSPPPVAAPAEVKSEQVKIDESKKSMKTKLMELFKRLSGAIDPRDKSYIAWLFLVMLAFFYNLVSVSVRAVFPYQTEENIYMWLAIDYFCDGIYLVDIFFVQTRLTYMKSGVFMTSLKDTTRNYAKRQEFKLDIISILPLDFFYFATDVNPLWRLPRYLRFSVFWEFFDRLDMAASSSGHFIRIVRTIIYMVSLIHFEACGYYAASIYEDFSTTWTLRLEKPGQNEYVRCFYLATKTATSIGKTPTPTNSFEYAFMTSYWLSGVFVFALLIGQIHDIFSSMNARKTEYRMKVDAILNYMRKFNVPQDVQYRVRLWFDHNWRTQKTLDELSLLEFLPAKIKTDLAVDVHFHTLKKVQIFQGCEPGFLTSLVIKLKPVLFLPRESICIKGEIGTEMYIIKNGSVEVVGDEGQIFVTLGEGSVFGEISLMGLSGGNRRTANVRAKGFSTLFTLSKGDFDEVMNEFPAVLKTLRARAKVVLNKNKPAPPPPEEVPKAEEIIKERAPTPKLFTAVVRIVCSEKSLSTAIPTQSARRESLIATMFGTERSLRFEAAGSGGDVPGAAGDSGGDITGAGPQRVVRHCRSVDFGASLRPLELKKLRTLNAKAAHEDLQPAIIEAFDPDEINNYEDN